MTPSITSSLLETAFPYRIGTKYVPDEVRTPEATRVFLDENLSKSKVVFIHSGLELRASKPVSGVTTNFWVLSPEDKDQILYSMRLSSLHRPGNSNLPPALLKRSSFQCSVWRDLTITQYSKDFVPSVFWKFLLSNTRNVVSDSAQSEAGEAFWYRRMGEALGFGKKVYGLDCEARSGSLHIASAVRISSLKESKAFYTEGENYDGYYKRLAICL